MDEHKVKSLDIYLRDSYGIFWQTVKYWDILSSFN